MTPSNTASCRTFNSSFSAKRISRAFKRQTPTGGPQSSPGLGRRKPSVRLVSSLGRTNLPMTQFNFNALKKESRSLKRAESGGVFASRPCWKRMPKASANLHRKIWMEVFGSGLHADTALRGWLFFELSLQHFWALSGFLSGSMQECLHWYR